MTSGTATITITAGGTGSAVPRGAGAANIDVTGTATATGAAPETFQATAEDVPMLMLQILLRLDDMANPANTGMTYGQVYDRLVATLSLLVGVLALLRG